MPVIGSAANPEEAKSLMWRISGATTTAKVTSAPAAAGSTQNGSRRLRTESARIQMTTAPATQMKPG